MKLCKKCEKIKPLNEFYQHRNKCKECIKDYEKGYRIKRNKRRSNQKEQQCKGCFKIKNIEEFSKNQERCKECNKKSYEKNKKEISKRNKIYRKENIEQTLLNNARNRAKKRGEKFNITKKDIINVIPKDNTCPLLNIKMQINTNKSKNNYNSFSLDQINSNENYNPNNIWVISYRANASKSNSTIEEYEKIVKNLEKIIKDKKDTILGNSNVDNIINSTFKDIKKRAKKKNIPFRITKEYLKSIYPKNGKCLLLDIDMFKNKGHSEPNSPSIDRIIPIKGYMEGNLIWISHKANTIKNDLSLNEMKLLLKNWKRKLYNL